MSDDNARWQTTQCDCEDLDTGEIHTFIHCHPTFGDEHILTPDCWCNPRHDAENWHIIIHNPNFKLVS